MRLDSGTVGLQQCNVYERPLLKQAIDAVLRGLSFSMRGGGKVMLKPNLVTAGGHDGLACTHPEFVAAVAEWFVDHGATVSIGDSPAFGTASRVMAACGIRDAVHGLPVKLVNFTAAVRHTLPSGFSAGIAGQALDCDLLVNLPKVKAHSQMLVSLAVKNYFGAVVGWRKPLIHARHGDIGNRFEALLVDLLDLLPAGVSILDGITAMHGTGPVKGTPYPLGLVAGAVNPVAADTGLLDVLGVDPQASPLWRECARRKLHGGRPEDLEFPLQSPAEVRANGFKTPARLTPVTFHPWRLLTGGIKRIAARMSPR